MMSARSQPPHQPVDPGRPLAEKVKPADFVLFKVGKAYAHGAIVMPPGWPRIIHADGLAQCVAYGHGDGGKLADPRCQPRFFTLWPQGADAALERAQRARVIEEAISWLRTPYHHAQRLKGVGVDCAMLPAEIYHRAGVLPPIEMGYYPRDWHHNMAAERYLGIVLEHAAEIEAAA
jgi:cell wall-associated NlpC family hydrolase